MILKIDHSEPLIRLKRTIHFLRLSAASRPVSTAEGSAPEIREARDLTGVFCESGPHDDNASILDPHSFSDCSLGLSFGLRR